jgi:glutathione S-transferase
MLMIANHIECEFRALNFVDDPAAAKAVSDETPINRVPVLFDGEQKIFDSRVIAGHLIKKHKLRPLTLDEENLVSSIYSCLDTGVTLFLMKREGYDMNANGFFLSRQRNRIPNNLQFLTPWVKTLDASRDWHYPAMCLYAFLYWASKRDVVSLDPYPEMLEFLDKFKEAPGVKDTGF